MDKIISGKDINGTHYQITAFPEAIGYLNEKLSELGIVVLRSNQYFPQNVMACIEFNNYPVVKDWQHGRLEGGLFINSAAGGCFMRPSLVNCHTLPKADRKTAVFRFELEIDTRDGYRAEDHSIEIVKAAIDEFVARCKVGFCYHFAN
jgi:hypothetical protein